MSHSTALLPYMGTTATARSWRPGLVQSTALLPDSKLLAFNENDLVLGAFVILALATIFICSMEIAPMIPFMLSQCNVESWYV